MESDQAKRTPIAPWLVETCHIAPEKGQMVADLITKKFWVLSIEVLQEMLDEDPEMLTCFDFPVPTERLIRSKLRSFNCRNLETLNYHEIMHLMQEIYPGSDYGNAYHLHKINGLVLSMAENAERLKEWGITDVMHANAVWNRLERWKCFGVPLKFLDGYKQEVITPENPQVRR